jgi:hypothetical protein
MNSKGVPGTGAALVYDRRGTCYLLTSHHVAFGNGARPGEPVWLVPADGIIGSPPTPLGVARHGEIGRVSAGGAVRFVDAALVEVPAELVDRVRDALGHPREPAVVGAQVGLAVVKRGPPPDRPGRGADADYPDRPYIDGRTFEAPGQILIGSPDAERNFAAPGDPVPRSKTRAASSSACYGVARPPVRSLACPISTVLECLNVSLDVSLGRSG